MNSSQNSCGLRTLQIVHKPRALANAHKPFANFLIHTISVVGSQCMFVTNDAGINSVCNSVDGVHHVHRNF